MSAPHTSNVTHLIRYRSARDGRSWLDQHPIGETRAAVVDQLVGFGHRDTLEAVYALDMLTQHVTDVTRDVLHALAAHLEAENDELPGGLAEAFERYDVPVPQFVEDDAEDAHAEHRLSFAQLGLEARS
ncbi:hypothetical protein [Methylobacterium soli]|uniref:Uncharacterized protein n=1 Tax=Methylobacterium soli TaxID=553447 RepID=A0A6L3T0A7_9HYPH|nr:hypothetical protein [Methylobacterium soli]KAB1079355.1 hypothetical protein F6X53_11145 [Methylobacterium soli]GJE41270.1 hypothetical protein AEGHOMDF_0432 [Methylobacterium soli]